MFRVVVAYEPSNNGELLLTVGDEVDNIKDVGNGWMLGRNVTTDTSGVFPEDCIDRASSISGALIRQVTKRPKSVKPQKPPKVTLLAKKQTDVDDMSKVKPQNPKTIKEEMGQKTTFMKAKFADMQYKLLDSGENQFRLYKTLFRLLAALLACGVLFVLLQFSFGVDIRNAGFTVIGMFVVLLLGFIFSSLFRCICLLMVPNLFTGNGRTIFLSIITGLLLTGPALNISRNTEEVTSSLGCTADLVKNQTRLLRKQLEEPIRELATKLLNYLKQVRFFIDGIQQALKPILNFLGDMRREVSNAINKVKQIADVSILRIFIKENPITGWLLVSIASNKVCSLIDVAIELSDRLYILQQNNFYEVIFFS